MNVLKKPLKHRAPKACCAKFSGYLQKNLFVHRDSVIDLTFSSRLIAIEKICHLKKQVGSSKYRSPPVLLFEFLCGMISDAKSGSRTAWCGLPWGC